MKQLVRRCFTTSLARNAGGEESLGESDKRIVPAIIPFIPLIVAAAGTGLQLAGVGQPSQPKDQQAPLMKPPDDTQAKKIELAQAAPSVQERLGGSVSPDFFATEVARVSGNAGDQELAKQVLSQFLGLGDTSEKSGVSDGIFGRGAKQDFSPINIVGRGSESPGFFEGLLSPLGQQSGGEGSNVFTGGSQ